jgi:hypothetical protein
LSPDKTRAARSAQRRRLKETAIQRIEGIVSGKVVRATPGEEFVV